MHKKNFIAPTVLIILDGFGYSSKHDGNAIYSAQMPFWNWLQDWAPHTLLHASGEYVGLLPGFIGNSEVGHLTLGSGRIVESVLKKIHKEIYSEIFFENKILIENFKALAQRGGALHLIGLLSDGGVHSHELHLYAILKIAAHIGISNVFIHAFLDGRDVAPKSAKIYLHNLQNKTNEYGVGKIASICGRFYSMDRDKNWDRTKMCYEMLTGRGNNLEFSNWERILDLNYQNGVTDEFIAPTVLNSNGHVKYGDGVLFFNFRPDRMCQLAECFLNPEFNFFKKVHIPLQFFISMVRYNSEFSNFNDQVIFNLSEIKNTLFDVLADQKPKPLNVFIIAETEKYAHVTYFFSGMVDRQLPNETRVLVPSIKVKNYVNNPEMSAPEITKILLQSLQTSTKDFYLVNYANPDMVGHSGDFIATVKACQCIDRQLQQIYNCVVELMNGTLIITADHGNAEEKIDLQNGGVLTSHTKNPVPFVIVNLKFRFLKKDTDLPYNPKYGIASVAPTILKFLGIPIPTEMTSDPIDLIPFI